MPLIAGNRTVRIFQQATIASAGRLVRQGRRQPWYVFTRLPSGPRILGGRSGSLPQVAALPGAAGRLMVTGGAYDNLAYVEGTAVIVWNVLPPTRQTGAAAMTRVVTGPLALPPVELCPRNTENPFRRVVVDYRVEGGARVSWELSKKFTDPAPRYYRLQVSRAGVPTAEDWADVGPVVEDAPYLQDDGKRQYGKTNLASYRVVLVTPAGTHVSETATPAGRLGKSDWLLVRELIRKEKLRHKLFGSCFGWLLKAKRYGEVCDCVDECTGTVKDSQHARCYGTGWVGGFHPPMACQYAEMPPEKSREFRDVERLGTVKPVVVQARFTGDVPINEKDLWVSGQGSDTRYWVQSIQEAATWKGVPIVILVELRPAPMSDVIYKIDVKT